MAADSEAGDGVVEALAQAIVAVEDFPKPGVRFWDVTSLMVKPQLFQSLIDAFASRYADKGVTHIVAVESRGFMLAAPLALALKCAFVPIRRARRLPDATIGVDVRAGPFSSFRLEMHAGVVNEGANVLVLDDVIGTGATLVAAVELVQKSGGRVLECACVAELAGLRGGERVSSAAPLWLLIPPSLLATKG